MKSLKDCFVKAAVICGFNITPESKAAAVANAAIRTEVGKIKSLYQFGDTSGCLVQALPRKNIPAVKKVIDAIMTRPPAKLIFTLNDAALRGESQAVKAILELFPLYHPQYPWPQSMKEKALEIAMKYDRHETVMIFAEIGSDRQEAKDFVLRETVRNGNVKYTRLMLEKGADVFLSNGFLLQMASYQPETEVSKILYAHAECLTPPPGFDLAAAKKHCATVAMQDALEKRKPQPKPAPSSSDGPSSSPGLNYYPTGNGTGLWL